MNGLTEGLVPAVEEACRTVGGGAAAIEAAYLDVGNALSRTLDLVAGLTARVEAVPAELTSESMTSASESLWRMAAEMSAVAEALPVEREALDAIAASLDGVRTPLERLVTSIRTIAILARSSRVESANLSSNRYNFVEFAQEISELAQTARDTVAQYTREFQRLTRLVQSARDSQAAFNEGRGAVIRRSVSDLQEAFDAIETRQHAALKTSDGVAVHSRRIADVVGDVIVGLQAGDSTRQRLEHVVEGLQGIHPAGDPDAGLAECGLQGAQLASALADFEASVGETGVALRSITVDAGAIVTLGHSLVASSVAGETLHDRLRTNLSSAGTLIRDCESARATVDGVMAALAETLAKFREGLHALTATSASITTVGLNASIKSARLGPEGRALAVIAQDLRYYSDHIVDDTKALLSGFEAVIASAEALDRARSRQNADRMAQADAEIGSLLQTLAQNEEILAGALDHFTRVGTDLHEQLSEAERCFADLLRGLAPAHDTAAELAGLGAAASAGARLAGSRQRRYSMASERQIHDGYEAA